MPLVFAYGKLQQTDVQLAIFGHILEWDLDYLHGCEPSDVEIDDPAVAKPTGATHYVNITYSLRRDGRLKGMVFDLTQAELAADDDFPRQPGYGRMMQTLASGRLAWVYVHAS